LASHPLLHTAEGELFREALAQASEKCGLAVSRVRERELPERASALLRMPADKLNARIAGIGKEIGPPWAQDQKQAAWWRGWPSPTRQSNLDTAPHRCL
jgi:hypothetical protein